MQNKCRYTLRKMQIQIKDIQGTKYKTIQATNAYILLNTNTSEEFPWQGGSASTSSILKYFWHTSISYKYKKVQIQKTKY